MRIPRDLQAGVHQWPVAATRAAGWDRVDYRVLATKKTSTMQKALDDAGGQGYTFVGMTVAETAMGGHELVTITRRKAEQ
jgi:hypothetical protein